MDHAQIQDIYPLSPAQEGILFHTIYDSTSGVYIEQMSYRLRGNLNVSLFQQAWDVLVRRHSILRTAFYWEEANQPLQVVLESVELPWKQLDWRAYSGQEQEAKLKEYLTQDRMLRFDLTQAPLMRMTLIQLDENGWQFIWSFHHLLLDGWSTSLLLQEFFTIYDALCTRSDIQLEHPRPYRDYIRWVQQQDLNEAEEYWRNTLKGFSSPTPLVMRKSNAPMNASETDDFAVCQLTLDRKFTDQLKSLARSSQITLNTLLQGAWAVLLSRYTGEREIVFGSVVSGRSGGLPKMENMVGLLINILPVRMKVEEDLPAVEWLKRIQTQLVQLHQYEHSPLVKIHHWSEVSRGQGLFESVFVFENYPIDPLLFERPGGLQIESAHFVEQTNYPLNIMAMADEELTIKILYDQQHFEKQMIQRILGHFQIWLKSWTENPKRLLAEISILTAEEEKQLLYEWNDTKTDYPREKHVHQLFEEQVEKNPQAVALMYGDETWTYQELNEKANQIAHYLLRQGLKPEDRVGIFMERSFELYMGILGILKAGGAYVPIDPDYPMERIQYMLEDSQITTILTQEKTLARLDTMEGIHVLCLDDDQAKWVQEKKENPLTVGSGDHLAYIMYTSGSTGQPKGTAIVHRNIVRLVKETNYVHLGPDEVILQLASISFDASTFEIWGALLNGGRLVIMPPGQVSLDQIGEALAKYQVTTLWLTVGLFNLMVDYQLTSLKSLRQLLVGGDVVSVPHVLKVIKNSSVQVINGYGPTENTTFSCCYAIPKDWDGNTSVPIGRPISNTNVYVLDAKRRLVPIGVPGELYVSGEGLARGYWRRPELTTERFVPHPFLPGERMYKTGDLVRWHPEGYLEFLGRTDNQVKIRGFRVELGELEFVLQQHPNVRDTVVVLRQEPSGTKHLVAYVILKEPHEEAVNELRNDLKRKLPDYMIPAYLIVVDEFPITANGKVDRGALPDPTKWQNTAQEERGAYTKTEKQLVQIWAEVLGREQVGVHDNFFELGGDSILAIQVVAKAKEHGYQFTPKDLFQQRTIAELAKVIKTDQLIQAEQGLVEGFVPLTPIQRWFFEQDLPAPHHYNHSVLLQVPPQLDQTALREAIEQWLVHHDALRMRFEKDGDRWSQINQGMNGNISFKHIDFTSVPEEQREEQLLSHAEIEQSSFNLQEGPLVRVVYFEYGPKEPGRLLIVIHHLVVDGVSWRILLEDLQTAYQQVISGCSIQLPAKTTSYRDWAIRMEQYAKSTELKKELDYWLTRNWQQVKTLPVDLPSGENLEGSREVIQSRLSEEATQALIQEVPKAYHTQITEVLLSALLSVFVKWTNHPYLLVDVESHGRENLWEDIDLSRTIGWFTSIYPQLLDGHHTELPGEQLKSVKEQMRQVPNNGIGFGLLKYLSSEETRQVLQSLPQAEISFNYLGQLDAIGLDSTLFQWAKESSGSERDVNGKRRYLLEINGKVVEGCLQVDWVYSKNLYQHSTIEKLATQYMEQLKQLIEHCLSPNAGGYTPSDFPDVELDQSDLDALLSELDETMEGE